ncbi:NTP transferase domain-containing protein [Methylobrevis pamukkalensis]|uniref:Molybdenum cofactor cytidylyltransferase n=1 Tax=Methylobrevis pamukkalensis TaxID=1439726 RepID=A0A1E3GZM3_9HYPH|nr:molybdopterin-binding/glycosyltransferase family 2 protein [Methylobrevis pamukkalensis]ODN69507.1 Molybdenum cofactor cytidylyltransferase [Methylobrevis pamukkalensis]
MRLGPVAVEAAEGAILAHAVDAGGTLRKGTWLGAAEVARLKAAGVASVVAARLEAGDVHEDEAARRIAEALAGPGLLVEAPATGRVNLFAATPGLFKVDRAAVDAVNRIDAGITLATRPADRGAETGRMVATVKIIPFAVPEEAVAAAVARAGAAGPVLSIRPFSPLRVAVISTLLPTLKAKVVDKTLAVLAARLAPAGASIAADLRVGHDAGAVAEALGALPADIDLVVLFGASAVTDVADVIPAGLVAAGGRIDHFGMPVDPGNLLLIGELDGRPVVGAPGCARSPRENGFDFVLERLLAGVRVGREDIVAMGVGGLLMDIVTRPAPRSGVAAGEDRLAPKVAALVLAAGRSSRMGAENKLLAEVDGLPLVRHAVVAALASRAGPVTVVTGHMAAEVEAALAGLPVTFRHNPDFADGLSASVRCGIAAVPEDCEAAVILLGDMPRISAAVIDGLIEAYDPSTGALIAVPTFGGRRGNPVLWSRRFFGALAALEGDAGARHLIGDNRDAVAEVAFGPEVALDVDTPEALAALREGRAQEETGG